MTTKDDLCSGRCEAQTRLWKTEDGNGIGVRTPADLCRWAPDVASVMWLLDDREQWASILGRGMYKCKLQHGAVDACKNVLDWGRWKEAK